MESQFIGREVFIPENIIKDVHVVLCRKYHADPGPDLTGGSYRVHRNLQKLLSEESRETTSTKLSRFLNPLKNGKREYSIPLSEKSYSTILKGESKFSYRYLDFLCLAAWGKSLAFCLLCKEFSHTANTKTILSEEYGKEEYLKLKKVIEQDNRTISLNDPVDEEQLLVQPLSEIEVSKKEPLQNENDFREPAPLADTADSGNTIFDKKIADAQNEAIGGTTKNGKKPLREYFVPTKSKLIIVLVAILLGVLAVVFLKYNRSKAKSPGDFSIDMDASANLADYEKEFFTRGFNDNTVGGQDCPTVSIADLNRNSSKINGCWERRIINIDTQSLINVIIYCHNTEENVGKNLRIRLKQYKFSRYNKTIFSAAIINDNGDTIGLGYAEAGYSDAKKFLFGTINQYKDKTGKGIRLDNAEEIFSDNGLSIGDIPGYSDCPVIDGHRDAACHEQWFMIAFRVENEFSPFPDNDSLMSLESETSLKGFNDNTIGYDCRTISVTNGVLQKSDDGCFGGRDITIDSDRNVHIIFYCHNTGVFADTNVRIKLNVLQDNLLDERNALKKTTFQGTIFLNEHDSIVSYANVFSQRPEKFSFVTAELFANQSSIGRRLFNADQIFSTQGLRIPDIPGYTDCPMQGSTLNAFCHQGWIDISFEVRNR